MESIILIGGGGHCKSCIDVIEQEAKYSIAGIIDVPEKVGNQVSGYNIIGTENDLKKLSKSCFNFFITIGQIRTPEIRIRIFRVLIEMNVHIPVIVSPYAYVSKNSAIGKGTIIMHYAIINAGASVGENCIINTKALIEHDSHISNNCHISTGAIVNGNVKIGNGTFYGSGAVCKESIVIPENSFIKANSIVR